MAKDKRLDKYISIYSILISIAIATGYFFDRINPISQWSKLDLTLWLSYTIVLFFIIKFLIKTITEKIHNYNTHNTQIVECINDKKYYIIAFTVILICYAIVWLAYYPGLWNYDPHQVYQVIKNEYSSWHPLIHTLLLGGCYILGCNINNPDFGVVLYDWIQMLIMAGIFAYICILVLTILKRKWIYVVTILFYAIFPFHSILAISSTKDVIFSGLVLLVMVLLLHYIKNQSSKRLIVALTVLIPLMLLFRNNASYAYVLFIAIAIIALIKKIISKRTISLILLLFVVYIIINKLLVWGLNATPTNLCEAASIPCMQMGRIYYESVADEEEMEIIDKYIALDCTTYSPHLADEMKFYLRNVGTTSDFVEMLFSSAKLFVKHPLVSIESILYLHEGAWYLGDVSHAEIYGKGMEEKQGYLITNLYSGYGITPNSKIPGLEHVLERLYSNNEYQKNPILTVIFSPAFYNWILIGCLFVFLYQKKYQELFVSTFLVCFAITVLLGPATLIRYYYPIIVSTPLIIAWVIRSPDVQRKQ